MSDIEKLVRLAEYADELLSLRDEVARLKLEINTLKGTRVLTTKEAAEILRVSQATVVNWVNKGFIPAITSKNGYRISENELFRYAEEDAARRRQMTNSRP